MTVEGFHSIQEQRALVYEYLTIPYGFRGQFLVDRGIGSNTMGRWRSQVLADTLDHGLVPRTEVPMSAEEKGVVKRLLAENQALREELDRQRRAVDALGKAIELLHPNGASKSSEPDAPPSRGASDQPSHQSGR